MSAWSAVAQPLPPADYWLANPTVYPGAWSAAQVRSNQFAELRAEVVAGKLVVNWTPDHLAPTGSVVVLASAADLAHWPTRDWRAYPMSRVESRWQSLIPVEDPDVPLAYFVAAATTRATNCSPMRGVLPGAVGLEEPTRPFWPFLEGFEQGYESWRVTAGDSSALQTNSTARSGYFALSVNVPTGKRSVTVATTRLRGWQARAENATGLSIWMRTRTGVGRAQCSLVANAGTTNQSIAVWSNDVEVSGRWQKVDLLFGSLSALRLNAVDLFAVEFTAAGPCEFLIDDLKLLGSWESDLD